MYEDKYRMLTKIVRNMKLKKKSLNSSLNDSELEIIRHVIVHPGISLIKIASFLCLDKAIITRYVKKLASLDYLSISIGKDKRERLIYPTNKALQLKVDDNQFERSYYSNLFKDIDLVKQKEFFDVLETIYLKSKELRKNEQKKKI